MSKYSIWRIINGKIRAKQLFKVCFNVLKANRDRWWDLPMKYLNWKYVILFMRSILIIETNNKTTSYGKHIYLTFKNRQ